MKKRILFDLDNTIIKWKDEYRQISMKEASIDSSFHDKLDYVICNCENQYNKLNKDVLIESIMRLGISKQKAIDLINADCNRFEIPEKEIFDLFDYLSSKYELVIVTNWFYDIQSKRLENALLIKYFKNIYSGDKYSLKPKKEIFDNACGNYNKDECLMIGDSIEKDVKGALSFGIDAIYMNNTGIKSSYREISNILQLKEML